MKGGFVGSQASYQVNPSRARMARLSYTDKFHLASEFFKRIPQRHERCSKEQRAFLLKDTRPVYGAQIIGVINNKPG